MTPKRILIVEDETSVADALVYALESDGFAPTWVATAGDGLAALHKETFAACILDIGLPDGNGFDLCRQVRSCYDIPILFLSARAEEVDRILGLELGADDYVTKPFSPREVTARVKAILRRAAANASPSASPAPPAAGLTLDEEALRITYEGRSLDLTRYEYGLLACLIRRPGRIFTRENLMQQVWEDPAASSPRTVDAHIKTLRAKLQAVAPQRDLIRTHRGFGYALETEDGDPA